MADAIIWCAKIRPVKLIFVGFVWDLGNPTEALGTIAIDMMKMKRDQPGKAKKSPELPCLDISFTATDI